jgi:glycosyltransferase involved in cell wall biosynthesis
MASRREAGEDGARLGLVWTMNAPLIGATGAAGWAGERSTIARGATQTIVMALENNPYPQDVRVRNEAEELVGAGYDVLVLAPRALAQSRAETIGGVRVKRYRLPELSGALGITLEYMLAVVQLSCRLAIELLRGADIVHLHNPPDLLFPIGGLARAMGRTVVFDHHDLAPELFEQKFQQNLAGRWQASILRWCERMTMRVAHVVIAANESHRRVAIERGHVDPERVVVVRNAPREDTLATAVAFMREGLLKRPRLCYVGSLGSQDGVTMLPEILARLCQAGIEPVLSLVGDGPELPRVKQLADQHGVFDRIRFMGHVPHDRVPGIIEAADVCLDVAPCTPLNDRSTMIKIGEYMAAGRPIVSFALAETLHTAGDCALYVRGDDTDGFVDSIRRLCEDADLRAGLSALALERVRDMTWERSAERLRHAYSLIAGPVSSERIPVAG